MVTTAKKIYRGSSRETYHSTHEEYHIQGGTDEKNEAIGFFLGEATKQCGLFDAPIYPDDKRVRDLFEGTHPVTGERLRQGGANPKPRTYINKKTQKEKVYRSVSGVDITQSLDKTVSALWAVSSERTQALIIRVFHRTIHDWMEQVEKKIGFTRTGAGGKNRERVSLFASAYTHFTNRNLEPQLHVHCVIYSACVRSNGKGGALNLTPVFTPDFIHGEGQKFRDMFKTNLAHEFRDYGLSFREEKIKNGTTFQIVGVPQELCKAWSSRRADIERRLEGVSNPTTLDVQKAVLAGRPKKNQAIPQHKLLAVWRSVASAHGFDAEKFLRESRDRHLMAEAFRTLEQEPLSSTRNREEKIEQREEQRKEQRHIKEEPPLSQNNKASKKQNIEQPKRETRVSPNQPPRSKRSEKEPGEAFRNIAQGIRDRLTPEWLRPVHEFEKELERAGKLAAQRREEFKGSPSFMRSERSHGKHIFGTRRGAAFRVPNLA